MSLILFLLLLSGLEQPESSIMLICVESSTPPILTPWDYFPDHSNEIEKLMTVVEEKIEIKGDELVYHPANKWVLILKNFRSLLLCEGDSVLFNYPCSIGDQEAGKETPSGWYRVISKIENPVMVWKSGVVISAGDWRNSFGTRWLGLGDWATGKVTDYGIHGTNSPEAIGKEISLGCIRMYNWDAEALFEQVNIGTLVVICVAPTENN